MRHHQFEKHTAGVMPTVHSRGSAAPAALASAPSGFTSGRVRVSAPGGARTAALVALVLSSLAPVFAQDSTSPALARSPAPLDRLTLSDAISRALETSIDIEQSRIRTSIAATSVDSVRESTEPRFTLAADPLYSLATQRGANFADITSVADFPPSPVTSLTNSTGVSLDVVQPLPSAGRLSAGVSTSFAVTTTFHDDTSTSYSLRPALSFALSQPLFVDGRFLDTEEPRLVLEQALRGVDESQLVEEQIRRRLTTTVISLYAQLGTLRRSVGTQRAQQRLLELQLDQARIREEQGQGSRQQIFTLQVQLGRVEESILQTELAAREIEIELGRLTGAAIAERTELENADAWAGAPTADLASVSPAPTLEERTALLALERARADLRLARKQERATSTAALSLIPRYADERESPDTLGGTVTDYFGEGAGVDVSLSIGLSVPLGLEASRARAIVQAGYAVELAERDLERAARDRDTEAAIRAQRIRTIEGRIDLVEFELEFDRDQLESELGLRDIGASTELRIEEIRVAIAAGVSRLADLRSQLFLAYVDAAVLRGVDVTELLTSRPSEE